MVLRNFFKLTVFAGKQKHVYYGSMCDYVEFCEDIKYEIIWEKPKPPVKQSPASVAELQQLLF
jgi:hypothetical protein